MQFLLRKIFLILLIPIIFLNTETLGDYDHLEPIDNYFTNYGKEYDYYIDKILLTPLYNLLIARIIIKPSFQKEYVISIDVTNNARYIDDPKIILNYKEEYFLTYIEPQTQIWSYYITKKDLSSIKTNIIKIGIDEDFAIKVQEIFNKAILQTRYFENGSGGLDGTSYYFMSFKTDAGIIGGKTWSPKKGTKMFHLTEIAFKLKEIATSNENIFSVATGIIKAFKPNENYVTKTTKLKKELIKYIDEISLLFK